MIIWFQTLTSVYLKTTVALMPPVKIPWDLTIALAKKDMEETEEVAQVKSSLMKVLEGIITTHTDSFLCTP